MIATPEDAAQVARLMAVTRDARVMAACNAALNAWLYAFDMPVRDLLRGQLMKVVCEDK